MRKHSKAFAIAAFSLLWAIAPGIAPAQSILTYAGGGTQDGRPATVVGFGYAKAIGSRVPGPVYISDATLHQIFKVDQNGIIRIIAGTGASATSGDGGPATLAGIMGPGGLAVDSDGNLFVADTDGRRLRKITPSGVISTIAGGGAIRCDIDNATATETDVVPADVAVSAAGEIYILDGLCYMRVVHLDHDGKLHLVAGAESGSNADGTPATAALFPSASGLSIDGQGNLFIAGNDGRVYRVDTSRTLTTFAGGGLGDRATADGKPATAALLEAPYGITVDGENRVYFTDVDHVWRVDLDGTLHNLAGGGIESAREGIRATDAHFSAFRVGFASNGDVLFLDSGDDSRGRVWRVDGDGILRAFAGNGPFSFGDDGPRTAARLAFPSMLAISANRLIITDNYSLWSIDRDEGLIRRLAGFDGEGNYGDYPVDGQNAKSAPFAPWAVATNRDGDLFVADGNKNQVYRISNDGKVHVIAGTSAQTTSTMCNVWGNGGFSGDGGPATEAALCVPRGLALAADGGLLIADYWNNRIRKVDLETGIISTIVGSGEAGVWVDTGFSGDGGPASLARLSRPTAIAVDSSGNLLVADRGNFRVRRVDQENGVITTVVGNGGIDHVEGANRLHTGVFPNGLSVDPAGDMIIASAGRVVRVNHDDTVSSLAGTGGEGPLGDLGPASRANIGPFHAIVDADGALFISDYESGRVRVVFPCQAVTPPQLSSPAQGSSGLSSSPLLAWSKVRGAFRYDVYLDTANPPEQIAAPDNESISFSPSNLEPLTTYYWKVVSKGDPYCEPFSTAESEVHSFTTANLCDAPGALSGSLP